MRFAGRTLVGVGLAGVAWTLLVWAWQEPLTALQTTLEQDRLAERYDALAAELDGAAARERDTAALAALARRRAQAGDPIGRLRVPRLGLAMVLVEGTDPESLKKGPGRDPRSAMPGEGELVYVAGHRTTYGAPFARIDRLRPGDSVIVEAPYGTFRYAVVGHRVVEEDDLSVLRPSRRELLRLQACHPRFFATHRYVVTARLVQSLPRRARKGAAAHLGT